MAEPGTRSARAAPDDPAFLERVIRFLEDALSSEETAVLERELLTDPRRRDAFAVICLSDSAAREELPAAGLLLNLGEPETSGEEAAAPSLDDAMILPAISLADAEGFSDEPPLVILPSQPAAPPATAAHRFPTWARWGGIAAAVTLAAWGGWSLLSNARNGRVATLTAIAGAAAPTDERGRGPGASLAAGDTLAPAGGYLGLRLADGTAIVVEAPAKLTLLSPNSIALNEGRLTARMATGVRGFSVVTPAATVTDLGTEFGVGVNAASGATEVDVFKGNVQVAAAGATASTPPTTLAAGEAVNVHTGVVQPEPRGAEPERFVRDLPPTTSSLDLVDLVCGGDGFGARRGGTIDPLTAAVGGKGALSIRGDGRYHRVTPIPAVDGCFIPNGKAGPVVVDSANHTFAFPATNGTTITEITAGAPIPLLPGENIGTGFDGVDYGTTGHGLLLLHPNVGLTLNLQAIRKLHPNLRLERLRFTVGNSHLRSPEGEALADVFVIADGHPLFQRRKFSYRDPSFRVNVSLNDAEQFLTLASTDGGDGILFDDILLGDPVIETAPR